MRPTGDPRLTKRLRVVLVGTGTGVGKTHVACALVAAWSEKATVVGLKPIETGVGSAEARSWGRPEMRATTERRSRGAARPVSEHARKLEARGGRSSARADVVESSDQALLSMAAQMFHVKQADHLREMFHVKRAGHARRKGSGAPARGSAHPQPLRSLYAFPEPVSPHLAARDAGTRIDLGLIDRWVGDYEAAVTVIETAGGLFSPLGHGATNFELVRALRPHAVILVAPDRLGVLHDLTTTLALAGARGGLPLGVVLSAPTKKDASTGRNVTELVALGIAHPITVFPRAAIRAPTTLEAARRLVAWVELGDTRPRS